MGLRLKFNVVLIVVFSLGLLGSGYVSQKNLEANAQDEVLRHADLMMAAAAAVRSYTVKQIKPQLELQLMRVFLPQSVPAYSATEVFNSLREKYPEYTYKEATLNPTNPRDRSVEWEADIIEQFRNHPDQGEIRGTRETPTGKSLFKAKPFKIGNPDCLVCHSTPDQAPKSMIKLYGEANGFGWKLNEVVGAQIVSVPMALPLAKAQAALRTFMISLLAVFGTTFVVLNLVLSFLVIRPIVRMSKAADEMSSGNMNVPDFEVKSRDEVGVLATSFNRLRRSLEEAIKLLE
jgi:HAMP domain-containing protein